MVCCQSILCGEASTSRLPGINPAGYDSHTGYQYDSISRVAGHRELAPPSNFSKLGGFNSTVFITSDIHHPQNLKIFTIHNTGTGPELCPADARLSAVFAPTLLIPVYPTCLSRPTSKSRLFSYCYTMRNDPHPMHCCFPGFVRQHRNPLHILKQTHKSKIHVQ